MIAYFSHVIFQNNDRGRMIESALFNVREGEQDHIDEIHDYGDENQQQQTQDSDV